MEGNKRYAISSIICGINGTGKTTLLKRILSEMVQSGNRVLVVTPDPIEWKEAFPIRQWEELYTFTGMRRIVYSESTMNNIRKYYSNGVLVLDDCRTYIRAQSNDFMQWLQIRRRQSGIDLFSVFHGLTQVPPVYFTFATNLILFYTKDNIKRRGDYVDDSDFEAIQDAKRRIEKKIDINPYAYEIVKLDKRL